MVKVDHPEQFPSSPPASTTPRPELNVTGTVTPDVFPQYSRDLDRLGPSAGDPRPPWRHSHEGPASAQGPERGYLRRILRLVRQALADQTLAHAQLARSKLLLLENGAIAQKDYELAVDTAGQSRRLRWKRCNGTSPRTGRGQRSSERDHRRITAPVSGVISDQQVTLAARYAGTGIAESVQQISDLSHRVGFSAMFLRTTWKNWKPGEFADVRLNAYPDRVFPGARISNIGPILDPTIRTAKVQGSRSVENSGLMRIGMFVTATFHGSEKQMYAVVPSTSHPASPRSRLGLLTGGAATNRFGGRKFPAASRCRKICRRFPVSIPAAQVVRNALVLENSG